MALGEPCGLVAAEEGKLTAAAQLSACGFDEKGAAAARAYEEVDLFNKVFR
jgi:hypothetical protein